jgi:3-deoxy-7-phosphoheptulonate synthase/chorismate mutase
VDDRSLPQLRADIDVVDRDLLDLLNRRAGLVREIRALKECRNTGLHDSRREQELVDALVARNAGPFPDATIRRLFQEILKASLAFMEQQGIEGFRVWRKPGEPDRVIDVDGFRFGEDREFIAGPCAVEDEEGMEAVASGLASLGVRFLRGGAFKPRTSPYGFQGLGEPGLKILAAAADRHCMAAVSEVVDTRSVDLVARYVEVIQVGARNMSNFELLKEAGRTGRAVLLKRGPAATLDELLAAAEYVVSTGNERLILCERGIRTFAHLTRYTLDISAVPLLRQRTPFPVVVDVSHAAGRRDLLAPLAAAAFAAGAQGVMVEVHADPANARSDAEQQITVDGFADLVRTVRDRVGGPPS